MKNNNNEITIKDLLDIFLPKIWLIALVSIVCAAALGAYSAFLKPETYTASSTFSMVKVPMSGSQNETTGINPTEIEGMQYIIKSSEHVLASRTFGETVREKLEGFESVTVEQIQRMVSISLMGDTTNFKLSVVSGDPALSKAVADITYEIFPEDMKGRFSYAVKITEIDPPLMPKGPDSSNAVRNAVVGFGIGFVASMLVVFVMAKMDVVIRSRETIESAFDIPVLGVIPRYEVEK